MIIPSPEWKSVITEMFKQPGLIMLLGAIDTGKSTFAQYLIQQALEQKLTVALIDADMGQSTLGLPGTIGMRCFTHPTDFPKDHLTLDVQELSKTSKVVLHFIGDTTPVGHLLTTLVGIKKLVEKAVVYNANLVVIDTTGLVYGDIAQELKFRKIELLRPKYLVAFQRNKEIEHLLSPQEKLGWNKIYRLFVSEKVVPRTQEMRRMYREKKFAAYFSSAQLLEIPLSQVGFHNMWFNLGRKLHQNEVAFIETTLETTVLYGEKFGDSIGLVIDGGYTRDEFYKLSSHFGIKKFHITEFGQLQNLMIGLNSEQNETLGIGLIDDINFPSKEIKIFTPLVDITSVHLLEFGFIRIDHSGKELGRNNANSHNVKLWSRTADSE
ncbi:MAG: Clp1/GlmU family protein [bacterium]|nr:Clp1/GlmU family protein [bacterium]